MSLTKKGFLKLLCPFLFLGLIVGWLGFGERGLVHLYKMDKEREAYLDRISRLEQEKQSLLDEIKRLRTDDKHIESIARREWGLIKDNEILYRFSRDKENTPTPTEVKVKTIKPKSRRIEVSKPAVPISDKSQ